MRQGSRGVGFELCLFSGRKQVLAHEDIDSRHRVGRYGVDVGALDATGEGALAPAGVLLARKSTGG